MPSREKNVKIYHRIFPTEKIDSDNIRIDRNCNKIFVRRLQDLSKKGQQNKSSFWEFKSDRLFFNCSQEEVFTNAVTDVVQDVLEGNTAVLIASGQTGSGKTFTVSGLHLNEEDFGILPRTIHQLLELKQSQPSNMKICIQMSYLEFSSKSARDLLKTLPNSLDLYKSRDATKIKIKTEYEALKYLFFAEGRKTFVDHHDQYLSNTYASVVTFHVISRNMNLTNPIKIISRLHIIDLSGNDSVSSTFGTFKDRQQIGWANVAKSDLEMFLLCLMSGIPQNIKTKYRQNALLYYLDGDFSNENILRFIAHIKVTMQDLLLTLSTLRFGNNIKGLRSKQKPIEFQFNESVELQYLKQKLQCCEKEKYLNSVLLNQDLASDLMQERVLHINKTVEEYLTNKINEITVMNVTDAGIVFKTMRDICHQYEAEIKQLEQEKQTQLETSLKQRNSKSISQSQSVTKVASKRSVRKSKDSLSSVKKTSDNAITENANADKKPKTLLNNEVRVFPDTSTEVIKKKKKSGSTVYPLRKSQSKRKSSSTSFDKRESKVSITSDQLFPIPDTVPENIDLWNIFITQSTSYKIGLDEYKENEIFIKQSYCVFLEEIKKMQQFKDCVDKCANDLLMAQTYRKFSSKDEFDENGFLIISYAENVCKEQLECAKNVLLEQQEKVLKCQEELRIDLDNRKKIIKKVTEEFDIFCRDQHKVPNSDSEIVENNTRSYTFEVDLENPEECIEIKKFLMVPEPPENVQRIRKLQKLMESELQKNKIILNKIQRRWIDNGSNVK